MTGETLPTRESLHKRILYPAGNGGGVGIGIRFRPSEHRPECCQEIPDTRTETPSKTEICLVPNTIGDIRMANLRHLRDGLPGGERGKQREMGEKLGMSESQLSQLIGKSPSKAIGDRLARNIEKKLHLPNGWLDNQQHDLTQDSADIARSYQRLTLEQQRLIKLFFQQFKK